MVRWLHEETFWRCVELAFNCHRREYRVTFGWWLYGAAYESTGKVIENITILVRIEITGKKSQFIAAANKVIYFCRVVHGFMGPLFFATKVHNRSNQPLKHFSIYATVTYLIYFILRVSYNHIRSYFMWRILTLKLELKFFDLSIYLLH